VVVVVFDRPASALTRYGEVTFGHFFFARSAVVVVFDRPASAPSRYGEVVGRVRHQ
jgi:hypothetical protein